MAYSELVKDINRIRSFLRDFYVFGFYSREEYAALYRISPRSYDNERRRMESWMQEYLRFYQNSSGRKVFLSVDGSSIRHNPLYRVFKAKSFTVNDVLLHFYLMDLLADGRTIEAAQAADLLEEEYPETFGETASPDIKTIRLKLEDLTQLGLLEKEKNKRTVRYKIASKNVDLKAPQIRDALRFFSEEAPIGVVGSFLLDKETDLSDMEIDLSDSHCFRFRHHYLMQAIDSEILCELLLAIHEKRRLRMRVDNAVQGSVQYETLPLKIFVSTENGREYLLSWNEERKRFYFSRMDRIIWVKQLEKASSWESAMAQFKDCQKNLWGVSFGGLEEVSRIAHLEMEIMAEEAFIVHRLEREKRCGNVTRTGQGRYLFAADVYDPGELLPWICSFTGRIVKLTCDDPQVLEKYREYLAQMAAYYICDKCEQIDMNRNKAPGNDLAASGKDDSDAVAHSMIRRSSEYRPILKNAAARAEPSGIKQGGTSKDRHDLVFHEVYGVYYNALAKILSMAVRKELTPGSLYNIVQDKAFGESSMYLPDHLLSGEWPFLTRELETNLKREPSMPLTLIQKRWLRSILEDPRLTLFLEENVYAVLQEQLDDVEPLYSEDSFCYFDRFTDGDPFRDPEYIRHFRMALTGIRQKKELWAEYQNQYGQVRKMQVFPYMIEYSAREDKFRVYAVPAEGAVYEEPMRLNIGRIRACGVMESEPRSAADPSEPRSAAKPLIRRESVVLELVDDENTLERAMFHFSFLEKKTERLETGKFRITLYYARADETEILIRILSFGHQLSIISEGRIKEEITRRVRSQLFPN